MKDIEKTSKMKNITSFLGLVNDKEFTDKEAMQKYIGELIAKNEPITTLAYSTETKFVNDEPEEICKTCKPREDMSWKAYVETLVRGIPGPYNTVVEYLTPYVDENITITTATIKPILRDTKEKLNTRMEFLEANILGRIRSGEYNMDEVTDWVSSLMASMAAKQQWANRRCKDIASVLDMVITVPGNIMRDHIDRTYLSCMQNIYEEISGFCGAVIDILSEYIAA